VASEPLAISQSTAWGAGGGLLAGLFPLIEERRIPQSERVTKDRLRFFVSLVLLPSVGVFIAVLDRSKCSEIDAATSVFVGFAASSLLQKWGSDSFNF
jgi:hypothetical protein